ncbi:MAG: GNAT family N-acetyltransferase [Brachybacterium sp.]|nr:GNAT family N-acetyltransferase [Brachybacterium sp.]
MSENSPRPGLRINPYDPSRREETVRALAAAFSRDTFVPSLVAPDHPARRLEAMHRAELLHLGSSAHAIDLALEDDGSAILGAAIWVLPGSRGESLGGILRAAPQMLRATGSLRRLRSTGRVLRALDEARPTEPHWYLLTLGVVPDAAGRGVGSALVRHRLTTVDAQGAPAYLEAATKAHVPYYARFGFRPLGQIRAPHPAPPIGMWRDVGAR